MASIDIYFLETISNKLNFFFKLIIANNSIKLWNSVNNWKISRTIKVLLHHIHLILAVKLIPSWWRREKLWVLDCSVDPSICSGTSSLLLSWPQLSSKSCCQTCWRLPLSKSTESQWNISNVCVGKEFLFILGSELDLPHQPCIVPTPLETGRRRQPESPMPDTKTSWKRLWIKYITRFLGQLLNNTVWFTNGSAANWTFLRMDQLPIELFVENLINKDAGDKAIRYFVTKQKFRKHSAHEDRRITYYHYFLN